MKVYLAAGYSRREELLRTRELLKSFGHEVTSRWIDFMWEGAKETDPAHAPEGQRHSMALLDIQDLESADVVISFTEFPGSGKGRRGGRHVEFGYALAVGKRMIVVGPYENVFHYLPSVRRFDTIAQAVNHLAEVPYVDR